MAPEATPATATNPSTLVGAFKLVAYFEAFTYLVLLSAVVVYRVLDGPDAIGVLGPIHGIAFLVYLALVLKVRPGQGWSLGRTLWVIFLSAVPFGGFLVGRDLRDDPS